MEKSLDSAVVSVIKNAEAMNIELVWQRYESQLPQCGFGETGLCCRHCMQGPCRISPFEDGPKNGVCGADADIMVSRGLSRAVAAGTASHGAHAKHMAYTLLKSATDKTDDYPVKDEEKLRNVAQRIGLKTQGRPPKDIAREVAEKALLEFSEKETPLLWAVSTVTKGRVERFLKYNVVPSGIDSVVAESMHRTTYGVDADPLNILLGAVKCAIADYTACHIATDIADILFGTPQPVTTKTNLGVIRKDAVNIALHGHNPLLSDIIVQVASDKELAKKARSAGAREGINIVGICCTGNEVLMRHGIPLATSSVSQETAILTGALDAMVIDYQCVMPSLKNISECFHTKLITTTPVAKISGATHIEFSEENARSSARKIIETAIEAFKSREQGRINIPQVSSQAMAGFSVETLIKAFSQLNSEDPLKPLIDNIVAKNIYGVCLFAGCNSVKITQDSNYVAMIKELVSRNILILATGCASGAFARHGFMRPEATDEYAGKGLKTVLTAIGNAVGLNAPLPPVLHMGSCVDNSRAVDVAVAVSQKLGVDIDRLPVVASAPEPVTEKAVAIGTWAVASGLPTHLGVIPPVTGSSKVTNILTSGIKEIFGGYFIVETDPLKASEKLFSAIGERRISLGIE